MAIKKFRDDINGLRTIAVISVLIFHYSHTWLPGGFVGVDVFFVISGFLMTSIIFRGLANNNFSFLSFLKARATRIIPALLTVIIIVMILGYIFLEPLSYRLLGKHAASSLGFVSNIVYSGESGYFNQDSFNNMLLHTWSLSVEWQFYVIYPLILIALSKIFSIEKLKIIVLLATISIFLFGVYLTFNDPVSSYFMFYARSWEMLIGGLAFLYPLRLSVKKSFGFELVGLALIFASFFIISSSTAWPGYMALIPVLGTYLCILANNNNTVLSGYAIQKIGLWSYSVYLVHWPIITFAKKLNIDLHFGWYFICVLLLSFMIYELIEKRREYGFKALAVFISFVCISLYISKTGMSFRVSDGLSMSAKEYHNKYYGGAGFRANSSVDYINAGATNPEFLITGDSYARQYASYIKSNKINAISVFRDWCFSSANYWNPRDDKNNQICNERYINLISEMQKNPELDIVFAQNWAGYNYLTPRGEKVNVADLDKKIVMSEMDKIIETGGALRNYFILGVPQGSQQVLYECLAKQELLGSKLVKGACPSTQARQTIEVNELLKKWTAKYTNVFFIDPNDFLCSGDKCLLLDSLNEPVYSDKTHLSVYGTKIISPYIFDFIKSKKKDSPGF